jgi:RimJ/RimL family protein N-acetyltransferase
MFPDLLCDDVFRLETSRLWLRWPRASDAARIAELVSDRDVAEATGSIPHPYPPGAAAEFVLDARRRNVGGRDLILVLTLKQRPNEVIGAITVNAQGAQAKVSFWLGKPFQGQGYMGEALRALTATLFRLTQVDLFIAQARSGQEGSAEALAAAGFLQQGPCVISAPARGGQVPGIAYVLTRAQFVRPGAAETGLDVFKMQTA